MSFPFQLIDLTHPLSSQTPSWNGSCGFSHEIKLDYTDSSTEPGFRVQQIKMHAGIGTHMDAPAHCIPGGKTIEAVELQSLLAPCIVIDVSSKSHAEYVVSLQDVQTFEQQYGPIVPNSFVIIRTGWEQFWETPEAYRNNLVFPCISEEIALFLLEKEIVGLGIDTLSPDRPDRGYPVHQAILGAGKYIIENVAYAGNLPPKGAYSLALPLKTIAGTEAPVRLVGLIPKGTDQ